jgi:hypothetical protein
LCNPGLVDNQMHCGSECKPSAMDALYRNDICMRAGVQLSLLCVWRGEGGGVSHNDSIAGVDC